MKIALERLTVIPFAVHPLRDYFRAFEVELESQHVIAHIDTGGTFLIMSPTRARGLGIELIEAGEGSQGRRRVKILRTLAWDFPLAEARLGNQARLRSRASSLRALH